MRHRGRESVRKVELEKEQEMSGIGGKRGVRLAGIAAYCLLIACVAGVVFPALAQLAV